MILMPSDPKKARIVTVVACTIVSLACGSNVCSFTVALRIEMVLTGL